MHCEMSKQNIGRLSAFQPTNSESYPRTQNFLVSLKATAWTRGGVVGTFASFTYVLAQAQKLLTNEKKQFRMLHVGGHIP